MARGSVESPDLAPDEEIGMDSRRTEIGTVHSIFEGKGYEPPILNRADLRSGCHIMGPAVITELSATTVVAPDYEATVDRYGNIIMESRTN
jgi:N-methylhydantoinase A